MQKLYYVDTILSINKNISSGTKPLYTYNGLVPEEMFYKCTTKFKCKIIITKDSRDHLS